MVKRSFLLVLILIPVFSLFADLEETINDADALYKDEQYEEAVTLLESALNEAERDEKKADVYWRLARATLFIGDQAERADKKGVATHYYEKGADYADRAIELDNSDPKAYFWKSSNIGKAGQLRGVLASLGEASNMKDLLKLAIEMEPNFADAYYVLGQLYARLPGWPISFGSIENAVSLARMSIDKMGREIRRGEREEINYDYYIQLASHLWQRNWDERKRDHEQKVRKSKYREADSQLEKGFFYEATITIPDMSDRREARDRIDWVIRRLESMDLDSASRRKELEDARELRRSW